MKTDTEIITIAKAAKAAADKAGDNWADYVDAALTAAGVETDQAAARELADSGDTHTVAVLDDGRRIECQDDGTWQIESDLIICGRYIQHDPSGQGHSWLYIDVRDVPASVVEEIAAEIAEGNDECDEYTATNGQHYRWGSR
jgi:hypothetical protein